MHLSNTSKAVAVTALVTSASAIAVSGPEAHAKAFALAEAEALALAEAIPEAAANPQVTPAPTSTFKYNPPDICTLTPTGTQSFSINRSLWCDVRTSTGTAVFYNYGQPVETYVTRHPGQWKKETVTRYGPVPTSTRVAVCVQKGLANGWREIDEEGNFVGTCPWGNARNPSRCSVM